MKLVDVLRHMPAGVWDAPLDEIVEWAEELGHDLEAAYCDAEHVESVVALAVLLGWNPVAVARALLVAVHLALASSPRLGLRTELGHRIRDELERRAVGAPGSATIDELRAWRDAALETCGEYDGQATGTLLAGLASPTPWNLPEALERAGRLGAAREVWGALTSICGAVLAIDALLLRPGGEVKIALAGYAYAIVHHARRATELARQLEAGGASEQGDEPVQDEPVHGALSARLSFEKLAGLWERCAGQGDTSWQPDGWLDSAEGDSVPEAEQGGGRSSTPPLN